GDVPRTAAHLVEAGRFEAVLGHRSTDDGVEADVGQLLTFVDPGFGAVVALDDPRRAVGEPRRHPTVERVGRLDDVVVDRDHGETTLGTRRFGQPRHLSGLRGGEAL